ncbi:restriction endonuclease subunit S [Limosilactobacillus mucosae]|uniref:restriction endonuclease subunit S n=1 Tax=Limosilactobacillus mucosae TaxID=97478 RepID=UPI0029A1EFDA|nr:restriction endonuclease subunit S [Limosilactobacillus mucosae]MDX2312386.1 restriction endonuclease subunit S [Limosilactobacillus mucosae]
MTKQNEKDAKRVPELRFKGFTDDWEQRKLGEIATIVGGGTPSTKNPEYWDGDINWYSPAEIGNQIYTEKSERQITELGLKKSSAKLLPVGTVLFTSRAGIGKTAILNKEACTNQGFQSIIPRSKMLNSYFLFSRTNSLKQYGETMGSGSTFVEISGKQMSKMPLFIPNINEQSKIAKLFQSLDRTITLHEEKQRQLERLKKALLQKMFADKTGYPALRFKGFTEKWEQRKLGEEFQHINERNDGSFDNTRYISVANMYFKDPNEVQSNNILTRTYVMRRDDIAFEGHPSKKYKFGRFVANDIGDGVVSELFPVYRHVSKYDAKYWKYAIQIESIMAPLFAKSITSSGNSSNKLNPKHFLRQMVNVPDLNEQIKIGEFLSKFDAIITLHDKKIQYLKQLKRGLLQKMFV